MRLTVQPMPRVGEEAELFLVVFQDLGPLLPREDGEAESINVQADTLIEQLERELSSTREDLEKTIQELEAANEELKSSNEELLSMNEELQSANEELETSKEEVQSTNEALARAHANLSNLLTSTTIATTMMDSTSTKLSGEMKPWIAENMPPAIPPKVAPIANASSLRCVVLMPIARAATSSSRIASQARPTREFCSRMLITITTRATSISR